MRRFHGRLMSSARSNRRSRLSRCRQRWKPGRGWHAQRRPGAPRTSEVGFVAKKKGASVFTHGAWVGWRQRRIQLFRLMRRHIGGRHYYTADCIFRHATKIPSARDKASTGGLASRRKGDRELLNHLKACRRPHCRRSGDVLE